METIAVTGGNGTIGEAILREVRDRGYRAVNLARGERREEVSDSYLTTDLLDAGEVYGSLARSDADAVIHMGTIPHPLNHPGWKTYESNAMSTYHVLEAATALDLEAACVPSSVNVIGYDFQAPNPHVEYLPVDEDHPVTPRDPYGIAKHAIEVTADGFGRMPGAPRTISSLRYPGVQTDEEIRARDWGERTVEEIQRTFDDSLNDLFTYVHMADAAAIAVDAVEADYRGHEVFWAVAADTTTAVSTSELIDAVYPDTEIREPLNGHDGLISIEKAREFLGWEPEHSWRDI